MHGLPLTIQPFFYALAFFYALTLAGRRVATLRLVDQIDARRWIPAHRADPFERHLRVSGNIILDVKWFYFRW